MALSLYVYTDDDEGNKVKVLTTTNRQSTAIDFVRQVNDYFIVERPELEVTKTNILPQNINRGVWFAGVILNNLFHKLGKHNVLFITNYNDSQWNTFEINHPEVSNPNAAKANLTALWAPLLNETMDGICSVKYTASFMSGTQSLVKYIFGAWGVPATNSNKKYNLGDTDWEIEPPVKKYDAVVMVGIPNPSGQVHNIEDIKSTFAPYCTDDFILLDMFDDENIKLDVAKLWPNFDSEEFKKIGQRRPQRIEGDKLSVVEEFRTINTYSLFTEEELDDANDQWNRISDLQVEYYMDFY